MELLKKSEHEQISDEILKKFIPMDALQSYYLFGYAEAMASLNQIINLSKYKDSETHEFFTKLIESVNSQNPEIKSYYERLKR